MPESTTDTPAVPGLPIFGNTLQVAQDPPGFFTRSYHEYGPVFRVNVLSHDYFVLAGKEGFDFFLREGERYFSRDAFYARFARELGTDRFILGEPANRHKDLRRQMRVAFSRQVADPWIPDMLEVVNQRLAENPPGCRQSVMDWVADIAFEQYGYVMCGRSLREHFPAAHHYAWRIMNVGAKLRPESTLHLPRYRRARAEVFELMESLMAERENRGDGADNTFTIMDALAAAHMDDGSPLPRSDLIACSLYGFVGTLIYIDRAASFLLYDLLQNPEAFTAVREEIDATFGSGHVDSASLRGMDVTRAALKESMRLHPIALALPFVVDESFTVEGHRVPAGSYCVISGVPNHFDEETYRCPHAFQPDRCRPPRSEHRPKGAHVPFGFSARVCPAVGLIETIVLTTLGMLLHRREISLSPPGYRLKTRLDPLPGPSRDFAVQFGDWRHPAPRVQPAPMGDRALEQLSENPAVQRRRAGELLEQAEPLSVEGGTTVIREGDLADAFYILVDGEIVVTQTSKGEVARLQPGSYFGEAGLLGHGRRMASCHTEAPATLLRVGADTFHALVAEIDIVGAEIAALARRRFLSERMRRALPRADTHQLDDLLANARVRSYQAGETIIRQGEQADALYLLLRGSVEVVRETETDEQAIAQLDEGDFFGEVGVLEGRPRTATVRAQSEEVEVLAMERDAVLAMLEDSPAVHTDIVATMLDRVQRQLDTAAGDTGD